MKSHFKINYVIATWAGKNTKRSKLYHTWSEPAPENTLITHLNILNSFKHSLSQITIMKPYCEEENTYENYYNFNNLQSGNWDFPIYTLDCKNQGYSNGQWLTAYEYYGNTFDYYILVEDDYCPYTDNFDTLLVEYYRKQFITNIGKLCGFAEGYPKQQSHIFPLHYESVICMSSETLNKLYVCDNWNGNPKRWLDKSIEKNNQHLERLKTKYIGAFNQVNFSLLFTKIGIKIFDYSDDYPLVFFSEEANTMRYFNSKGMNEITTLSDLKPGSHIIVPIQFACKFKFESIPKLITKKYHNRNRRKSCTF